MAGKWYAKAWLCGIMALLLLASGCVERQMHITSEPEGATVVINQSVRGKTPFTYRFKHYGTYDIRLEAPGYYPLQVAEPIAAPLYEQPGLDLVSEAVIPSRIRDYRHLHYRLAPIGDPDAMEDILSRQEEMRNRSDEIAARRKARDEARKPLHLPLKEKEKEEEKKEKPPEKTPPPEKPSADTAKDDKKPPAPQPAEAARGPEL
ncbi:MAG: PEGA domain-containing protein [Planctomycetota bacterium]|nr:PEGA domain-containing protein [Planctomycetota bacterium]